MIPYCQVYNFEMIPHTFFEMIPHDFFEKIPPARKFHAIQAKITTKVFVKLYLQ